MVTSSAVVGSSAISSFGLQASAMAIITRWRMPPESWCGYSRTRRAGVGDADQRQHLDGARLGVARRQALVQPQRLADLAADGQHRVQAGHRLLEDHADVVAADARASPARRASAGRGRRSGSRRRSAGRLRDQAQDRHRGDRLAAAALADDRQRLAGVDMERQPVDRAHDAVAACAKCVCRFSTSSSAIGQRSQPLAPGADRARRAARRPAG